MPPCMMNRVSRYLANARPLAFGRAAVFVFWVCACLCHQATPSDGKVFEQCELAHLLRYDSGLDLDEVAYWVCIAQHSSFLNTSAFGGNARSGSHGIFQISDTYWCSPPGKGVACGISCDRLRDDDITDDLECARVIYNEHQRLSGDGYNAWNAYELYCRDNPYEYVEDCFGEEEREYLHSKSITANSVDDDEDEDEDNKLASHRQGKVFSRCELARELFLKHKFPMEEIPTWVCIAQHESNYDTSAVGRLNADGSADHGLFQISDLYWCSHKGGRRKACGMPCNKLLDSDITDDVNCVRKIFKEHTRISGDGFNAWTVYSAYCHGNTDSYVRGCFDGIEFDHVTKTQYHEPPKRHKQKLQGKVYEPCELADELRNKHQFPEDQIATWVCIAKHESDYNTSAIGQENHGLFQISNQFWCSPPGRGLACGISCDQLEDSDITDDVECIRTIYDEHTRLTGDGFNAWPPYARFCSDGRADKYIAHCPVTHTRIHTKPISTNSIDDYHSKKGKKYNRCELAKELLTKHDMSMDEIPTWVCIAQHESNYDTSAVGRLNTDGSADHGLFQISDLYWCSHKEEHRKACGLPCSKLLDNDISDDIKCVKQIYNEHTRISGNGFTAWTVYNAHCRERAEQYIRGCFDETDEEDFKAKHKSAISNSRPSGKVYDECELAKELLDRHHVPKDQIPIWVCIAKHQSGLDTSSSLSNVHGLFHISDEFWCSPPGKGKACGVSCADLEDNDITDDVECVRKIYEEHDGLSGNGFNAWSSYSRHCSNDRANEYVQKCPGFEGIRSTFGGSTQRHNYGLQGNNKPKGKVYRECELASELQNKHRIPRDQVPIWVCIAKRHSGLDTSSTLSNVHGIFHISDEFWCSRTGSDKACDISCADLEDSDISDDVKCAEKIFAEHQSLSGNGFNAWSAYSRYCSNGRANQYVSKCPGFENLSGFFSSSPAQNLIPHHGLHGKNKPKGKVYEECELARELRDKHFVSRDQISTWICIAKHQSGLDTSSSVSNVHGLFHISDEFWCSPPGKGKGCELSCSDLEDSDISDDIQCVARIYEEHQRLFGNGFHAWVAYSQYCSNGRADEYVSDCPEFANSKSFTARPHHKIHPTQRISSVTLSNKPVYKHVLSDNIFLKHYDLVNSEAASSLNAIPTDASEEVDSVNSVQTALSLNPFLKHLISGTAVSSTQAETVTSAPAFNLNPFLKNFLPDTRVQEPTSGIAIKTTTSAPKFFGIPITSTPTTSSRFETYQQQNEERAKFDAFKSFGASTSSISSQTPRANRLQTYQLNTVKAYVSPTLPTDISSTPTTNRMQPYQLNAINDIQTTTPRTVSISINQPLNDNVRFGVSTTATDNSRGISSPTVQRTSSINQFSTISTVGHTVDNFRSTPAPEMPTIANYFKAFFSPTAPSLSTIDQFRPTSTPTTRAPIIINKYRTISRPTVKLQTTSAPKTPFAESVSTIQPLNIVNSFGTIAAPTEQPLNIANYFQTTSSPTTQPSNAQDVSLHLDQPLNIRNQLKTTTQPLTRNSVSFFRGSTIPPAHSQSTLDYFKSLVSPTTPATRTIPTIQPTVQPKVFTRTHSVYKPTIEGPSDHQDTGRYDPAKYGRHGRYDSGRYDPAKYESERYSSNERSSSTTTLKPSTLSAGRLHGATPTVFAKSSSNIQFRATDLNEQPEDVFRQTATPTFTTPSPTTTAFTRYNAFNSFITPTVKPFTSVTKSFTPARSSSQHNLGNYFSTPSLPSVIGLTSTTVSPTTSSRTIRTTSRNYDPRGPYRFGHRKITSNVTPFSFLSAKSITSNELDYEVNTNTKRETMTTSSQPTVSGIWNVKEMTPRSTTLRPVILATAAKPATNTTVKTNYIIPSKLVSSSTGKPGSTPNLSTKLSGSVTQKPARTSKSPSSGSTGQAARSTGIKSTTKPVYAIRPTPSSSSYRQLQPITPKPTAHPTRSTRNRSPSTSNLKKNSIRPATVQPISKSTANHITPTVKSLNPTTTRSTTISPSKPSRSAGSLFTPKINISDLYYKLYGIPLPSRKTSSTTSQQPATLIHAVSSSTS